jgi:hypothetical protein
MTHLPLHFRRGLFAEITREKNLVETEGLDVAELVGMIDQDSPESVGVRTLDPGNPR